MPSLIVPPHAGRTVFPLAAPRMAAVSSNPLIRIAVPNKGSLSEAAAQMLREAGYAQRSDPKELVLLDEANGVEFFYLRPRDIALYVGEGTLDIGITGRDLLLSAFFGSIGLWPHHEPTPVMHARVDEVLAWLGLPHLADRLMTRMSSGEARRLLIGRALIHRPRALILDEPMTSLDLGAAHDVRSTMRKLSQDGTTLLLVTHDLADIVP